MNRPAIKKILNVLGNIATLAAVCYLLATLVENADRIRFSFSLAVPAAMALFCCMHCIQACILRALLTTKISFTGLLKIHSASQVYKYLPGNVAHYFSRWVYLRQQGVLPRENTHVILHETFAMVTAFGLFALIFIVTSPWLHAVAAWPGARLILTAGIGMVALAAYVFRKKTGFIFTRRTLSVILLYCLAALLSGLILVLLSAYMVPGSSGIGFGRYTFGFAVSFLAGFVVPGSPGGIGVREFVFVEIFRHNGVAPYLLTQLIVLFRVIAVATELLLYCVMNILLKHRV